MYDHHLSNFGRPPVPKRFVQRFSHNFKVSSVLEKKICKVFFTIFVCVEVLRPSQPNGVMSSVVSLPNHTFTGQA